MQGNTQTEKVTFQSSLSEHANDTTFNICMCKFYWLELQFGIQSQQNWKNIISIFFIPCLMVDIQ